MTTFAQQHLLIVRRAIALLGGFGLTATLLAAAPPVLQEARGRVALLASPFETSGLPALRPGPDAVRILK